MHLGRKRALVVSGAVASLLGAGALVMPSSAGPLCPFGSICDPIQATSEGLGIIPDPTKDIIRDLLNQSVFPEELSPTFNQVNTLIAPAEAPVYSVTSGVVATENELTGEITPRLQELSDTAGGPTLYECDPKHDHKPHKNHKHCEGE